MLENLKIFRLWQLGNKPSIIKAKASLFSCVAGEYYSDKNRVVVYDGGKNTTIVHELAHAALYATLDNSWRSVTDGENELIAIGVTEALTGFGNEWYVKYLHNAGMLNNIDNEKVGSLIDVIVAYCNMQDDDE